MNTAQRARFTWPTWGPPGSYRPQVGPTLAPWTLLSGCLLIRYISKSPNLRMHSVWWPRGLVNEIISLLCVLKYCRPTWYIPVHDIISVWKSFILPIDKQHRLQALRIWHLHGSLTIVICKLFRLKVRRYTGGYIKTRIYQFVRFLSWGVDILAIW